MKDLFRLILIHILRLIMMSLRIFPINKKRIIFNSYRGGQYSCNPKYISEYIEEHGEGKWEIIWAFNQKKNYTFLEERGIKTVAYTSLKRFFYEATAIASINNVGSFSWLPCRKGQLHINTWHGGGCYKKVAMEEKRNSSLFKKSLYMTAEETTHFLSSSKFFSEIIIPLDFGYKGKILECGMPRNDILFSEECKLKCRKKVLEKYQIKAESYLILYAPTWRYDKKQKINFPDFEKIREIIKDRFGKRCEILIRLHPNTDEEYIDSKYFDVSEYPDMQELLGAADMLISDYSSCIWDFSITGKPCFLYIPDINIYEEERGFVKSIDSWRFPCCRNEKELFDNIRNCDETKHRMDRKMHQDDLGTYEKGNARENIYKLLCEIRNKGIE